MRYFSAIILCLMLAVVCVAAATEYPIAEILWPSYRALPWHVDLPTVAHELGFTDRYRDVCSFSKRIYRSYQWDVFSLMSAQNGPDPAVTKQDLKLLIEHYLENWLYQPVSESNASSLPGVVN